MDGRCDKDGEFRSSNQALIAVYNRTMDINSQLIALDSVSLCQNSSFQKILPWADLSLRLFSNIPKMTARNPKLWINEGCPFLKKNTGYHHAIDACGRRTSSIPTRFAQYLPWPARPLLQSCAYFKMTHTELTHHAPLLAMRK